ncbi:hypothetical protein O3U67_14595 [Brevundimonas diminuta]|nr:hypothetical protein [Brevundimonas diminuta]
MAEGDQPGAQAAFIAALNPDAICIERPPAQAARGDYYEFTYEVQDIVLPYASTHNTPLCPIDWMPPVEDQLLAFGVNLDAPPEVRAPTGFQGFLTFPDAKVLQRDLFAADLPETTAAWREHVLKPAPRADRDISRRLFLYRTFMQAQLVRAAALARPGETVLVVVGEFHKADIEAILAADPRIELVQPSALPRPDADAIAEATTPAHRAAILSFNLLGRQAETGIVAWDWIGRVLAEHEAANPGDESRLLRLRHDQLTGLLSPVEAVAAWRALADEFPAETAFTWTGIRDHTRLDSWFDPFGNLLVKQRAQIELVRALYVAGQPDQANAVLADIRASLNARKARQLNAYAAVHLRPAE